MLAEVRKNLKNLVNSGDCLVVGLSGGADSSCLLNVLLNLHQELGLKIFAVHINHGLRGENADRDEEFTRTSCKTLNIPFLSYQVDTRQYAAQQGLGLEQAGRRLRYKHYAEAINHFSTQYNIPAALFKACTAHNQNDLAETVLMRLLRGASTLGLGGITACAPIHTNERTNYVVRPLIGISRAKIEAYCAEQNIPYVNDETNAQNIYTRNKIRNELIPYISKNFNPNIIDTLARTAELSCADEALLNKLAECSLNNCIVRDSSGHNCGNIILDIERLTSLDTAISQRVLRLAISRIRKKSTDISHAHIKAAMHIAKSQTGKYTHLGAAILARREYQHLVISPQSAPLASKTGFSHNILLNQPQNIPEIGKTIFICTEPQPGLFKRGFALISLRLDSESWNMLQAGKFIIRTRQPGDKIYIQSIKGNKSLQDYFTDIKLPRQERARVPLIALGSTILCIIDARILINDKYSNCAANETEHTKLIHIYLGEN